MQPNDPLSPRPDNQPVERNYTQRPMQLDFRRPSTPQPPQPMAANPVSPTPPNPTQPQFQPSQPLRPQFAPNQPYQAPLQSRSVPAQQFSPPQPQTYQHPPNAVPVQQQPPKLKRHRNWLLPLMIFIVLAILGLVVLLAVMQKSQDKPNQIFKQALESTLMTNSVEVQTNDGGSITNSLYNLSNSSGPIVSNSGNLRLNGAYFELSGYGTLQNTYVEYTNLPVGQMNTSNAAALNKWVQLRSNGVLAPGINTSLASFADPRSSMVGDIVFGDFTSSQSASLVQSLIASGVYQYQVSQVKQVVSGGQVILEYPVTLNITALKAWNQKILTSMGIPSKDLAPGLANLSAQQSATGIIYINKVTNQLIRFDLKQNSQTTTMLFLDRNKARLPNPPTTYLSWQKFAPQQNQLEKQAALAQSDATLDAERKTDLNQLNRYIQNYFTSASFYPTLADLNNQVWVSVNMQGINPDVFKDPQGSSLLMSATPMADSYAYEPLGANGAANCNDGAAAAGGTNAPATIPCVSYKLVTILSNGQQYVLNNLIN
jgi:hypothetical protein